ncbi:Mpo1 family 2-hydroxy fatty acid dioxygenase [Burkholderia multivorans]|jgi:uncharacterized membrane protein YGL010W|uniref:Mpo1 family 2-hydroxy fatty acid dioxygenase n=1 Tax=Burkholderia multivorans TaxID=87883 RepID=UPI0008412F48|nr:Mpo1-like protein [Burkholderia multivorans]AOJ93777.1 hypothetical protein WK22_13095 [Burkholderia multivorans]MBU9238454.1 DUF962 domain-containing protein [Burkholderia multivorans]MBU9315604.1 DUF962 domain-containing protein [Burkholderia multivorans]MBY4669494.1 DUF962 domain-containing protein [Burkholderia multivorans]MCA8373335.1 DUF962 domain-containing protein [Burkholderia multivorans]
MKTLEDHLSQYAAYHRDARNIATHLVGIPLIVFAVEVLLSRPALAVAAGVALSPALLLAVAIAVFYVRLDRRFGIAMAALLALGLWAAQTVARLPTAQWLAIGVGAFVIGWIVQFVGHWFEGRKPAFVDDLIGLAIGPLFVVAELAFFAGWRDDVRREVERRAGPARGGRHSHV